MKRALADLSTTSSNRHHLPYATDRFRSRFQSSLKECVRRGFTVEEAFGMVWEETCEEYRLSDAAQAQLYDELIAWAKSVPASRSFFFRRVTDRPAHSFTANRFR